MSQSESFRVTPLDATFGATVTGLKLAAIDDAAFSRLYQVWLQYGLLVFPAQHLTNDEQVTFAKRFGALEFGLAPLSNVRADGSVRSDETNDEVVKVLKGNMGWHCDSTYMPVQAKGAVFTAHVVPPIGGETGWADMCAAYDALTPQMKTRIENLRAYHSVKYSQAKAGLAGKEGADYGGYGSTVKEAPLRPLVKVHPETGRRALMVGRHAFGIPGLDANESEKLLDELAEFACRPPRVYHHTWSPGDAVVWDNRSLMHRACPWDMRQPRVMYHARIAGDPVSEFAAHT